MLWTECPSKGYLLLPQANTPKSHQHFHRSPTLMSSRPHFSSSISTLEALVEEKRSDPRVLASVEAELRHRETERAAKLRARIAAIRDGLELPLEGSDASMDVPVKVEDETKIPQSADERDTEVVQPKPFLEADGSDVSESQEGEVTDPIVVARMIDLIDYVVSVEKDKLKIVTDVTEHRAFHRTHDELATLPGVHFNAVDGYETAWLKVERLAKIAPPVPSDPLLAAWAVLPDDPDTEPRLRDSLSAAECRLAGIVIEEDRTSLGWIEFCDKEAVELALASYVEGPWATWSAKERLRRQTMTLYAALFALQSILSAPDGTPQEFVCGIGYAALERGGRRLRYPLLTVPLDIELDRDSHVISVVPREEVSPAVEVDPLDALDLPHVDEWRRDARQILEGLDDAPLSPFVAETYDPILRQAAALLDPQAKYLDGNGAEVLPPPAPGPTLVVSNAFGFFQRERRATQLMDDLLKFRGLLEQKGGPGEIPGAIAALFTEPSEQVAGEDFPTFRGINSIPGMTSSDGSGADLFFPKPFNSEQVQIAQRLAVRDGVVVQGPPGTGKTHTIANIISHYLATGRRVLVTSQKTPALQVLQAQLPAAIRPLAISLLDSDREGLRQFRASVDLIAERLQGMRMSEIENEIAALDSRIDGLHRTLARIDSEIESLGRNALKPVVLGDQTIPPLDAAKEVLDAGEDARWIEDAITPSTQNDPAFTNDEIAACREARAAIGELLIYLGKPLPPVDLFDDIEGIVESHKDLAQAAAIKREINAGELWPLADERAETIAAAKSLHERLTAWALQREKLARSAPAWDDTLERLAATPTEPLLLALRALADDAATLAEDYAWFLTRPVEIPLGALEDPRFLRAVEDLENGGQGLSGLVGLFSGRTKKLLAGVRLRGVSPGGTDDWKAVARHIRSHQLATVFINSWNHALLGTPLPALENPSAVAGRDAMQVLDRLDALSGLAKEAGQLTKELRQLLPRWGGTIERQQDPASVIHCLQLHLDRARLVQAEAARKRMLSALGTVQTPLHEDARAFVSALGSEHLSAAECREQAAKLSRRIEQLSGLTAQFEIVEAVSTKVRASGAKAWAERLRTIPAHGEDPLCPGDWHRRWRLRRLATWLDSTQKLDSFRSLHQSRQTAESDLSHAYVRLIEQRTWLALKRQASPAVMAALSAYAVAVGRIGKGTGKSANRHRKTARQAANAVKRALPCWIMPHHRVSESLPSELGVFDLVIVDEASQSTLAALPALFRARQILVVGDDKQVSPDHVGLAMDQANARAARYLSSQVAIFRAPMREEASLYDLASVVFGGDNLMLREHFRCAAPIIEFSKRQFYRNELRPLRLSKASERLDPVLVDVRVTDGYRKGKTNPAEADYIVAELRRMGKDPAFEGRTFGVTTLLGTEQAALIYKKIESELGIPFIEKFRVRVGDPSAFQGDERDIMFLSMVVTAGNATALSGLGYEQRFNVAASRAREKMVLVRSIDLDQLSPRDELRRAILEHFRSPFPVDAIDAADARSRCESDFEREMFDELVHRGYSVDTQVRVGAHRIDMVVEGEDDRRLAIECDGDRYHGPEQWPADMARQRTLERAGWRIWRCFASRFVRERETVLSELTDLLAKLDIQPRRTSERSRTYTELREWNSSEGDEQAEALLANAGSEQVEQV